MKMTFMNQPSIFDLLKNCRTAQDMVSDAEREEPAFDADKDREKKEKEREKTAANMSGTASLFFSQRSVLSSLKSEEVFFLKENTIQASPSSDLANARDCPHRAHREEGARSHG